MFDRDIGRSQSGPAEILRTHGVTPFREVLTPQLFQSTFRVARRASTILIPEVVFWLMATVALEGGPMAAAVSSFWATLRGALPYLPMKPVTEEAFCMARRVLAVRFFRQLFAEVVDRFDEHFPQRYRWHGLRLQGIDGMEFDLPHSDRLRAVYVPPSNQHGSRKRPQARLVGLVGLHDGVCRGFRLVPLKCSEQRCARSLVRKLKPQDLLLCDKNFANYRMFGDIHCRGAEFLFRVQANRFHRLPRTSTASGRVDEWYVILKMPAGVRKALPGLPATLTARILQYQIPGFRPSRLITSLLDVEKYPYEDLARLYHERWRQETEHREWKYTLQISNLRSKTPAGILKEVLVQLTLNNVIRWIMADAAGEQRRPVDLKFLESKRLILAAARAMATARTEHLPGIYRCLLEAIGDELILVRPGRSYPRTFDERPRNKGHGKRATPARLPSTKEPNHDSI